MAIRVALTHTSRYRYDREVTLQPHVVRLRPAPHGRTPILAYSLRVTPKDHFLNWQQDPFGNYQARLVFNKPARELTVEVDLVAEMIALNPFDFFVEEYAENYGFRYEASLARELAPYSIQSAPDARFGALIEEVHGKYARPGRRNIDVLVDINRDISQRLRYDLRMEPGVFEPEETLVRGHGSCRDFAWLEVELLRRLGYAARFVSGYSIQLKPDVKPLDGGPGGVAEDIADLHAWVEVYLPGAGWIGLDATSGLLAGEGHIPLAATAWPTTAAAISGSFTFNAKKEDDKVEETATFAMRVQRVVETARVTKPYRDDQWAAINALGARVDQDLQRYDVRLTMGGEPTFVSIDDRDAPEWNIAALGDGKRRLADKLARRLRARFAPGGLMHHGQGKWYPGEPLPRWAYAIYFRRDGEPVWTDPTLFAVEPDPSRATSPADRLAAHGFVSALANRLGLSEELAQPTYEDAFYYLWRERRLPINVNVLESKLEDPIERARLARVFGAGLGEVAGYILPLRPRTFDDLVLWESGRWSMREGHLFLLPGDSPMGYRLPLDGLPWESEGDRQQIFARDPLAARPPLGAIIRGGPPGPTPAKPPSDKTPDKPKEAVPSNVVRTALCVEPREGMLHVFMPPVELLEEYLALVAAVEDVAHAREQPVRIEGYHPPTDYRLDRLSVTPDPGVIEVNVHPTRTWSDLTEVTEALYEEARLCRLGTEKFMLDGRHTGTGGGNHIVLGGATPSDSPFLRRPDMLRSLVGYFVNHPSLSYLFSGMFVGPTSQAPRLDEARQDNVHELELAFGEVRRQGAETPTPPWLVDRIFRNLLVDVSGNTHRTEICIDKLYSPDSATGRLGLVELRAFEMPPHAQMSLTQQLLLRSMVAWFWRAPYLRNPVRWGTGLVDRFTLPHFVEQDFEDVLDDLRNAGYPFATDWFRAHRDFRFPLAGTIAADGVTLDLRQAIEPWHVLGEEPGPGGTARYVDSSVERLEIMTRGLIEGRHVVACNGRRVPLHPTGSPGEAVAGVRYRAWQPPSALHPTIGVHVPLVFDLIDSWTGRAIAGCTYHVAHPGGLSHERLPTNALEAEGRRIARFTPFGHTPGAQEAPPEEHNPDFPLTLDLRRPPPPR